MKYLFYILAILFSNTLYADPHTEVDEFSGWYQAESFINIINSAPTKKYPAIIQGGALLGDGVEFRVLFNRKPSNKFKYHITFGVSEKEFTKLNYQYIDAGFMLIHCQTVKLMSGLSYQAVWVKNGL